MPFRSVVNIADLSRPKVARALFSTDKARRRGGIPGWVQASGADIGIMLPFPTPES
ncbi:MAG: hypothetical protein BMS9Abin20_0880 [Acidimicrobiia bacterium]|nr:MAG: hypothetical protein BMS9Abin20_0880 [Acidimicrobiia bacterium]